jgi:hypothetical protein
MSVQEGRKPDLAAQVAALRAELKKLGVGAADVTFTADGLPVVQSFKIGAAVEQIADADPANIQQVAAAQMRLSTAYYEAALSQARQSFRWALIAAVTGTALFIVAIGILLASRRLDISVLSAVGGGLSQLIAALNFWLYGRTSQLFRHTLLEQGNQACWQRSPRTWWQARWLETGGIGAADAQNRNRSPAPVAWRSCG